MALAPRHDSRLHDMKSREWWLGEWYFVAAPRSRSVLPFNLQRLLFEDREVNAAESSLIIGSTVIDGCKSNGGKWRERSIINFQLTGSPLHWLKSHCSRTIIAVEFYEPRLAFHVNKNIRNKWMNSEISGNFTLVSRKVSISWCFGFADERRRRRKD